MPDNVSRISKPAGGRAWRPALLSFLLACFFTIIGLGMVGWWFLMPHGFPLTHSRFWANTVFPLVVAAACTVGTAAAFRNKNEVLRCLALAFGAAAVAAVIAARLLFPRSVSSLVLAGAVSIVVFGFLLTLATFLVLERTAARRRLRIACLCCGLLAGAFYPWSQRGDDPATRPRGAPFTSSLPALETAAPLKSLPLSDRVTLSPRSGRVSVDLGGMKLHVDPLLTFHYRSPDRFWALFAPPRDPSVRRRSLTGMSEAEGAVTLEYQDDGMSHLRVSANGLIEIEAQSRLPDPVYSHLNSFVGLFLRGAGGYALSFSPCPDIIALKPFDYPTGLPIRLAYVDGENTFRVVEARSGEKGPFRTLAEGAMEEGEPLEITILDNEKPLCRIAMPDWAPQASRQLSPTAGWGLPENAIEFLLDDYGDGAIFITLAGTSVGRGWDSVGHAAGNYCNRMIIEPLAAAGRLDPTEEGGRER